MPGHGNDDVAGLQVHSIFVFLEEKLKLLMEMWMIMTAIIEDDSSNQGTGNCYYSYFQGQPMGYGIAYPNLSAATPGSQSAPLSPISDPDNLKEQSVIGRRVGNYSASSPRALQCHSHWIISLSLPPEHRNAIPIGWLSVQEITEGLFKKKLIDHKHGQDWHHLSSFYSLFRKMGKHTFPFLPCR